MIRSELYINNTRVELNAEVQASITYQIADIRMPDKRQGSFSKTISLPGSPTINNLFTNIFNINLSVQTSGVINFSPDFNPNLKASFVLLIEGVEQFRGYMKLQNIIRQQNQMQEVMYEVNLFGDLASIFTVLTDTKMSELDLSAYDHTYNKATQVATWNTANINGNGYVYPMINYGGMGVSSWDVNDFFPAIYVKTYIDAIFDEAGYTYTSSFFNTSFFKHLIVPFSGDKLTITTAQAAARLFRANTSALTSGISTNNYNPIIYNAETVDPLNQFNTSTGQFTTAQNGYYSFYASGVSTFDAISTVTQNPYPILLNFYADVLVYRASVIIATYNIGYSAGATNSASMPSGTILKTFTYQGWTPTFLCLTGDVIQVKISSPYSSSYGYGTVGQTISANSIFVNQISNPAIFDGATLLMNSALPIDIKQSDFLMSIIRMFNLFVETDKNDSLNLIVDTYDTFYASGTTQDWSALIDVSKPITITPMGALDAKRYTLKYSQDSDYWNKRYFEKYNKTYGEYNLDITNDFIKNENKNEVMFGATPSIGSVAVDRIIPEIYQVDSSALQTQLKSKLRILYYAGAKNTVNGFTYTSSVSGSSSEIYYPYAGHIDDPITPTTDLSFGVPHEIYYVNPYGVTSYTNNNIFNQYHKLFIDEITDVNSKIVTAFFRLQPLDILKLSFRNKIYIDGQYYRLNKVIDYNPLTEDVTKCELLKIKNGVPFVGVSQELNFISGVKIGIENAPQAPTNIGNGDMMNSTNNVTAGRENFISPSARHSLVNGSNNFVGNDAENICISASSGVTILGGIKNVTVINTNDITIDRDNTTYINGLKVIGTDNIYQVTASQTIAQLGIYECTSASAITLSLDVTLFNVGDIVIIKNLGTGTVVVEDSTSITIDGALTQNLTLKYDSITIYYNGTQYLIK